MISETFKAIARREMPAVAAVVEKNTQRHHVIELLSGYDNLGIELGVAQGVFAERMVRSRKFREFFGVDVYGDIHNTAEYKAALQRVGLCSRYKLLRMTFDEAVDLFDDQFFDFIYVDGFAHTGEEGGETLIKWYQKLKIGGVMAGDDYHDDWPLVQWAVNHFVTQLGVPLHLTDQVEETQYCRYPSWFFRKHEHRPPGSLKVCPRLREIGRQERERVQRERTGGTSGLRGALLQSLDRAGLKQPIKRLLGR